MLPLLVCTVVSFVRWTVPLRGGIFRNRVLDGSPVNGTSCNHTVSPAWHHFHLVLFEDLNLFFFLAGLRHPALKCLVSFNSPYYIQNPAQAGTDVLLHLLPVATARMLLDHPAMRFSSKSKQEPFDDSEQ